MPSDSSLGINSQLIGLWLQLFAVGAYLVYLPQCWFILRKKLREGLSLWMPVVCVLMAAIVTTDAIIEMHRAYHAFSVPGPNILPNPSAAYVDPATPESLVKNSITVALAIISDVVIVYRTFIVWDSNYVIILIPMGLLFSDIALGIWSTWTLAQTRNDPNPILAEVSMRVRYFFIITFCLNTLCASLICFKIWRISSRALHVLSNDRTTWRVFEVICESAGLYCAYLFIIIVTDSVGSNVFFIFLDALPPVTALVFSMLIVRTRTKTQDPLPTMTDIRFSQTMRGPDTSHIDVEFDLERAVHTDTSSLPMRTVSMCESQK
ncbi:hypothetical protein L226DRAFT_506273 [Lentinus tigrinus ALCF2SS1-7]|uniref:Uncharacterized protein n=1 Tax=Lentinus tigrinus ALCF2SS1-6 TaxID=1328759 RepID=A0A5C2SMK5_9APHY|nr:hypothetical protein L227DRAFT_650637 [Lentinus tigrinus ALCF2SS1-6]RPD76716.1 hypothetical protein L226DRAFT_506273 [Lentinus tigrinus ALCF2SS1-7]